MNLAGKWVQRAAEPPPPAPPGCPDANPGPVDPSAGPYPPPHTLCSRRFPALPQSTWYLVKSPEQISGVTQRPPVWLGLAGTGSGWQNETARKPESTPLRLWVPLCLPLFPNCTSSLSTLPPQPTIGLQACPGVGVGSLVSSALVVTGADTGSQTSQTSDMSEGQVLRGACQSSCWERLCSGPCGKLRKE